MEFDFCARQVRTDRRKESIPEAGERSPESGFMQHASAAKIKSDSRNTNKKKGILKRENNTGFGPQRALTENRGRIPIDDLHKSASEGEGACSMTSAGRSHLPLRGKLGWMTPRIGQKKTDKRNAP